VVFLPTQACDDRNGVKWARYDSMHSVWVEKVLGNSYNLYSAVSSDMLDYCGFQSVHGYHQVVGSTACIESHSGHASCGT